LNKNQFDNSVRLRRGAQLFCGLYIGTKLWWACENFCELPFHFVKSVYMNKTLRPSRSQSRCFELTMIF
jgi:hypothetical protein